MADKKITELTQLTSLASGDLFVVVDDPTGTPITKKITASDIFGNGISYVTNATYPAAVVLRSVLTANVNANTASANTLIAAEFVTNALGTSANTEYQYAVRAVSKLHQAAAKVTKEHAVAKFVLDVSNSTSVLANSYVSVLSVANSGVRVANVHAFVGFGDVSRSEEDTSELHPYTTLFRSARREQLDQRVSKQLCERVVGRQQRCACG